MMNALVSKSIVELLPRALGTRGKQRISLLIYHRVLQEFDYMRSTEPTALEFNLQMELLARYFNPLSLSNALQMLDSGKLPERAVCVTFDDGYADNEQVALPILKKWNIPATVFVATGFLNGGQMWNDTVIESLRACKADVIDLSPVELGEHPLSSLEQRSAVAQNILRSIKHWAPQKRQDAVAHIASIAAPVMKDLMLTDVQLKDLHSGGVEIGAHTVSHPILASLSKEQSRDEIEHSKVELEKKLDSKVRFFAYPNGVPGRDYLPFHRDIVKDLGFESALSTHWGVASKDSDRWQMPRFTPWDRTPLRFITRLLLNFRNQA